MDFKNWKDNIIVDDKDKEALEYASAKNEFIRKMPRIEAEQKAYSDYKKQKHLEAASHHLSGLREAASKGDRESGEKHHALLILHRQALGENPDSEPGPNISSGKQTKEWVKFKNHINDILLSKK